MYKTTYYNSPVGWIKIEGSENGIRALSFIEALEKGAVHDVIPLELKACVQQLAEYFAGKRQDFDLKFDWQERPPFDKSVWKALLKIPYGKTVSYSDIANEIDNPKAVRAVGAANGRNPIAIIVPCHRVIGKNGNLTGYASGLQMKRALLRIENPQRFAEQGRLF